MTTPYRDGVPVRNLTLDTERGRPRYGYLDPYANGTGRPEVPRVNNWTYITSDTWFHNAQVNRQFWLFIIKVWLLCRLQRLPEPLG